MGDLDVVDESDNVIGKADYKVIHSQGLRHRSVQIFVFQEPECENLFVTERSLKQKVSANLLQHSAAGHVRLGQSYEYAARVQLKQELFAKYTELPSGITLVEIVRYQNDSRDTNRENTCLFGCDYRGEFSLGKEVGNLYWQNRYELWEDMQRNPDRYTFTFKNAMREFRKHKQEQI